jgi:DNA-binding MurR/RpiR family transcriptional regulator
MNYISIKEACERYNVSNSTIRRIVKECKSKNLNALQFDLLPNGIERILISVNHLDNVLNKKLNTKSDNSQTDVVTYLMNELSEKNKQIEQLHVLMSQLQTKALQLDEAPGKKKRWFQRNK